MRSQYIFASLTRISDLKTEPFEFRKLPRDEWENGDYVVSKILDAGSSRLLIELPSGRMRGVIGEEYLVGALGERYATLEATGTWREVGKDLKMHVLTAAGLMGKLTSKSVFIPQMMEVVYLGHAFRNGMKLTMDDFVKPVEEQEFKTPIVLFIGTSMSAGKTTSARIVTNIIKSAGYKVVGAKLTGAGRYKDVLALKDVGADAIFDFVDVGLPSSICPVDIYRKKLKLLLNKISSQNADIAIVEIGASPLEPYNGDEAISTVRDQVVCTVLSASDPYAVYGLTKAFDIQPNIVTGIASNTLAGREMVRKLCGIETLNLIDSSSTDRLKEILTECTGFNL